MAGFMGDASEHEHFYLACTKDSHNYHINVIFSSKLNGLSRMIRAICRNKDLIKSNQSSGGKDKSLFSPQPPSSFINLQEEERA